MNKRTKELKFCWVGPRNSIRDQNSTFASIQMADCTWLYVIVVPQPECVWKVHLICSTCVEGGCMVEWLVPVMGTDLKSLQKKLSPLSHLLPASAPCTFQQTRTACSVLWLNLHVWITRWIWQLSRILHVLHIYRNKIFWVSQSLWDGPADGSECLQTWSCTVCSAASTLCERT